MTVGEFCNRDVVIVSRSTPVNEVARLMRCNHVGDVVVVDEVAGGNSAVGIVTDRDLVVEVLAEDIKPDTVTAGDVMASDLLSAREADGLWQTMDRMRRHGVRRVPVMNSQGLLAGIMTADDMLELLGEEISMLARVSVREQQREQEKRADTHMS